MPQTCITMISVPSTGLDAIIPLIRALHFVDSDVGAISDIKLTVERYEAQRVDDEAEDVLH
jgi:hypothetical protein